VAGSVATLERTTLGEARQWTLQRGHSDTSPILLVITGGLGGSTIGTFRHTLGDLERHCTVVTWDCRGSGKALRAGYPKSTMTVRQLTSDALELVAQLRERYQQKKIFLLGHALGTVVAVRMIQERPEWFRAYVSIEQLVNPAGRDVAAWQAALDAATTGGNKRLARRLRRAGPPPYTSTGRVARYALLARAAKRLLDTDLGLVRFVGTEATGPELRLVDRLRAAVGQVRTFALIYPRLQKLNLITQAQRLEVPAYLVTGESTPAAGVDLVQAYHDALARRPAARGRQHRLPAALDQPDRVAWFARCLSRTATSSAR
jgi:pimeloyl-ACP methyl ester carboxylesterase